MSTKSPYEILGICNGASQREIVRAYRKLALRYHPDRNPRSKTEFLKINEAYKVLINGDFYSNKQENTFSNTKKSDWVFELKNNLRKYFRIFRYQLSAILKESKSNHEEYLSELKIDPSLADSGGAHHIKLQIFNCDDEGEESLLDKIVKINIPAKVKDGTVLRINGLSECNNPVHIKVRISA